MLPRQTNSRWNWRGWEVGVSGILDDAASPPFFPVGKSGVSEKKGRAKAADF